MSIGRSRVQVVRSIVRPTFRCDGCGRTAPGVPFSVDGPTEGREVSNSKMPVGWSCWGRYTHFCGDCK